MNGSAPNSPATGSHVLVRQKPRPNFWIDSHESFASVKPMATTTSSNAAANAPMLTRNPRSGKRTARLRYLDPVERRLFEHHDAGGQRGVAEIGAVLLAIGQRPAHEVQHHLPGGLVLRILVEQQPR